MPNHRGVLGVCRLWSCSIDIAHHFLPAYAFIFRAGDVWAPAEVSASVKLHHCWKPSPPIWKPWAFLFGSVSLQPPALFPTALILCLHLRGQVSQDCTKQVAITYHVLVGKAYLLLLFPLQSPSMQVCSRCRIISSCKKFSPVSTGPWRLSPSTHTQSCILPPCCLSGQRQSPGCGKRFHSYLLEPFCWN